mgnify:CR=1 FL=1
MSDNKVIDITELIKKRKAKEVEAAKKKLDLAIDDLGIDLDKILNTFVFFDPAGYYLNREEDIKPDLIIGNLESASSLLRESGMNEFAEEIENIILKINNLRGENNED